MVSETHGKCGILYSCILGPLSLKHLKCYHWDYSAPWRAQRLAGRKKTLRPQYELNHAAFLCLGTSFILLPTETSYFPAVIKPHEQNHLEEEFILVMDPEG